MWLNLNYDTFSKIWCARYCIKKKLQNSACNKEWHWNYFEFISKTVLMVFVDIYNNIYQNTFWDNCYFKYDSLFLSYFVSLLKMIKEKKIIYFWFCLFIQTLRKTKKQNVCYAKSFFQAISPEKKPNIYYWNISVLLRHKQ